MSTHFTIPVNRSPCSGARYQVMPSGLSSYLSDDEYAASMGRIQAANRSTLGVRLLYAFAWVGYMMGLFQLFGMFSYGGDWTYDGYYVNNTWMGLSVAVVSFVALIALGRYMRKQRAAKVAAAVQVEHISYQTHQPQLAWRVVNESLIEINVVDQSQSHIAQLEHQVHFLQAQVAAAQQAQAAQQHHQAVDHELIAHQAAAAAAAAAAAHHAQVHHRAPTAPVSPPAPQYYPSVMPVAEPVYAQSVYQPAAGSVFAHPPPQYYNQPRADLRAPLVHSQYQY